MGVTKDQFEQLKTEPPLLTWKIVCQVRPQNVWVGLLASENDSIATTNVWSTSFKRPEGKTTEQCVDRAMELVAPKLGLIFQPLLPGAEDW